MHIILTRKENIRKSNSWQRRSFESWWWLIISWRCSFSAVRVLSSVVKMCILASLSFRSCRQVSRDDTAFSRSASHVYNLMIMLDWHLILVVCSLFFKGADFSFELAMFTTFSFYQSLSYHKIWLWCQTRCSHFAHLLLWFACPVTAIDCNYK